MRGTLLVLPCLLLVAAAAPPAPPHAATDGARAPRDAQERTGWYVRSDEGTHWLRDAQRQWLIGSPGGYRARRFELLREEQWQWAGEDRHHSYGCAKMIVRFDRRNARITELYKVEPLQPRACRNLRGVPRNPLTRR